MAKKTSKYSSINKAIIEKERHNESTTKSPNLLVKINNRPKRKESFTK